MSEPEERADGCRFECRRQERVRYEPLMPPPDIFQALRLAPYSEAMRHAAAGLAPYAADKPDATFVLVCRARHALFCHTHCFDFH